MKSLLVVTYPQNIATMSQNLITILYEIALINFFGNY